MGNNVHAFVIRVWNESIEAENSDAWRGYIEHVNHDSRMYFSDFEGVARFIQQQVGVQSTPRGAWWRGWLSRVGHAVQGFARKPRS